ncbi:MAG: hypothetical protein V4628_11710 [Pseudomonadota bacterium]
MTKKQAEGGVTPASTRVAMIFPIIALMQGCATTVVENLSAVETYSSGSCEVTVYQSQAMAQSKGQIIEACSVSGSSAFSFDHTLEGAIKKNIDEVCGCGVTEAYVESRQRESELGMRGVSYVTLIGFRRAAPADERGRPAPLSGTVGK